ncbi:type II secretion system protein GspD [Halarcobacter ebronensis]|uniref:Type II secretion system protein GspD n=1 Tax=Halarcobacter ebronensis TaxID=1462615 RepID=A0A4Q0YCZ8_9BACT|nr:type II secretion system secretin GspD [Halarcobacter ebronensis]RXJ68320.1 type II secretion system protein GspD [Halarcobacter ebronensis]
MKLFGVFLLVIVLNIQVFAKGKPIDISFQDLEIEDLIKITSKIINKNILIINKVSGKVDFITNKQLYEEDIFNILMFVLESKGFTIVDNLGILRVVKIEESTKYNLPVYHDKNTEKIHHMITKVFPVQYSNVEYVASKIRYLISKSAKLVTDKESNVIVITDFVENINTIENVIKLISKDAKKSVSSIKLKNIQATKAVGTLKNIAKSVFNTKIEKENVVVLANNDNNSILIVGKDENVKFLENYIKEVDEVGSMDERNVDVIPLKNVEAKSIIKIVTEIIDKKKYLETSDKPHASIDEETNSLIIVGNNYEIEFIKKLINELDTDRLQVYVQAKIIEVSANRTKNLGLKYGLTGAESNSSGIFSLGANLGGSVNALSSGADSLLSFNPQTLSSGIALGATLNLLKNNQAIDIVSEPSILCINNKESSIYVGETKSFQTGTTTTDGGTTSNTFQREDVGLTLKVKPRISDQNRVTLEIETVLEDAKELKDGQTNPDTTKKEVKTTAIVLNGESVILGGLIKNKNDIINDEIPFLGDIPLLGNLFKNTKKAEDKINLVVIMTPYIIPKSKDLSFIRNQLSELEALEEEYAKDLELRLEKRRLEILKKDQQLKEEKKEIQEEIKEIQEDSSDDTNENNIHEQQIKMIMGYSREN